MPTISKSKLKANMLRVFREIEASGEELIVTDRNRPVLRISPMGTERASTTCSVHTRGSWSSTRTSTTIGEWAEA